MYEYGRSGNPTRGVLEACLASLDGAKHALCFSSGLGTTTAITPSSRQGTTSSPWMTSTAGPTDTSGSAP